MDVWRGVPFVMLLMLAGLQTIPREQYEAAAMDGANAWQRFRYVTLPNLRYLLVVASTLDIINTIRHYDIIGVMTGGGPAGATEVLPVLLYNTAFRGNRFGEAAAIGVLLLVIVLAFSIVHIRVTRPDRDGGAMIRALRRTIALRWALALAALAVVMFPFYWMVNTSLKPATRDLPVAAHLPLVPLVARRLRDGADATARRRAISSTASSSRSAPRRSRSRWRRSPPTASRASSRAAPRRSSSSCCSPRCCRRRCSSSRTSG